METGDYQKLHIKQFPAASLRQTTEGKYWRRFAAPATTQHFGLVSHISCSPVFPHDYAVTSATRVLIYNGVTHALKKTITRFSDTAYSGEYRADGKLIAAGCESGMVQVFDLGSRSVLRQFKLHKRPTHVALFAPTKTSVLSASDDTTVRLWDLAQGEQVLRLDGHADYVRAGASASESTWLTGSYDHTVRLWDVRVKGSVLDLEHGAPLESVTVFPGGRIAASAGETAVCIWDLVAGGRLLRRLTSHQKTVSCVRVVNVRDASGMETVRLLSGALDGHVKVYDLDTFKITYAYKYPAPVLSVAVTPNLSSMIVGLADRSMVVRRHRQRSNTLTAVGAGGARLTKKQRRYAPQLTAATYKYFLRGMNAKASASDFVVKARRRARLEEYDVLLKQFRYSDALDAALKTGRADVVATLMDELVARSGLNAALANRDAESLGMVLKHACKYVAHPHHARLMLDICNHLLDLHVDLLAQDPSLRTQVNDMKGRVSAEVAVQQELQSMQGALDMLMNARFQV